MSRLTIREALEQGYTVDTCVYPHVAHIGSRFAPHELRQVLTELETALIESLIIPTDPEQLREIKKDLKSQSSINMEIGTLSRVISAIQVRQTKGLLKALENL